MNTIANSIRVGREFADRIRAAGIDPNEDEDFGALLDSECDALEIARKLIRRARHKTAHATAIRALIKEDEARKERLEEGAKKDRALAASIMTELGLPKLLAPDFTASFSKGKPALVGDLDANTLPDHLVRIKREPDKAAIRSALEAGEAISGVSLGNGEPVLTVRS